MYTQTNGLTGKNYTTAVFFVFFFLCGFSFTTIHESQDCRGRGRVFH